MDGFRWSEHDRVRWLEAELPGGRAAFTSRLGGIGKPPFDSLNLGAGAGDDPGAVRENRRRLVEALDLDPDRIGFAHQVHGKALLAPEQSMGRWQAARPGAVPEGDGQVIRERGQAGLVFVADCVPIVLSGPRGVAVLHGGWRGLAAGIAAEGVASVEATAAAVGPSIGPCCYEVGDDVLAAFTGLGPGVAEGRMLNLWAVADALLRRAGVAEVACARLCTRCNPELFFSHRGQGPRTGRQAGIGWIEDSDG